MLLYFLDDIQSCIWERIQHEFDKRGDAGVLTRDMIASVAHHFQVEE